jgi:hypothetical protein
MTAPGHRPSRLRMITTIATGQADARQAVRESQEHRRDSSQSPSVQSAYHHVAGQIAALIPFFGVQQARPLIERSYGLLCRESLAFPYGRRPSRPSRLNADGTPFQFSLTVGASRPPFQFVTDTGARCGSNAQRISADRDLIRELSVLCDADHSLPETYRLLDEIAPPSDAGLLAEEAGATWLGMSFSPGQRPRLKIYINVKWGDSVTRWARLAAFSGHLGAAACWAGARAVIGGELEPLGASLVIGARSTSGRIYLSGYGKPFSYYEKLARTFGGAVFQEHLRRYGEALLQGDYAYPTQSVVCSLGIRSGWPADFKVELCGHCAFDSDVEAKERCVELLQRLNLSTAHYLPVVDLLSQSQLSASGTRLHSYLGTGSGRGIPYSTFYFNPASVIG